MDAYQVRATALAQAAHDMKGSASASEVVKRAEEYLRFLIGLSDEARQLRDPSRPILPHSVGGDDWAELQRRGIL